MPGPICIITQTGMICEATSYHRPYFDANGKVGSKEVSPDAWQSLSYEARVNKLMKLAKVKDGAFMIIERPVP
jgi:hypothetical protein